MNIKSSFLNQEKDSFEYFFRIYLEFQCVRLRIFHQVYHLFMKDLDYNLCIPTSVLKMESK